MTANEQDNSNLDFDTFGSVFKNMWEGNAAGEKADVKTYKDILNDYNKFFSLDEEVLMKEAKAKSGSSYYASNGNIQFGDLFKGSDCFEQVLISFKESIAGVKKNIEYDMV